MAPRKKILFINQSLATGGIETMIVDMIRLLPAERFAPEVVVFEGGGVLEKILMGSGIPVHHLHKQAGMDVALVMRLRRLMQDQKTAILHTHNFSAWLYGALAVLGLSGIRHVHTEHSGVFASRRYYFAERWLSRMTDHVVAVSSHVQNVMTKEIGIAPARVKIVLNGVDTARFRPDGTIRTQIRESLGYTKEDFVIGIVARLVPVKNHSLLLNAFASFGRDLPTKKKLLIVGDGTERGRLEALSQELGISELTQFLGDRRDTDQLFNAMDAYVLCSVSEGMNLTLLEAMSSGLPVVATAVGGNSEIIEHGVSGYLVPLEKPVEMGQYLQQLAMNRQLRNQLGATGRISISQRFNDQAMIEQYLALYDGAKV